jgi:hypothetical protein
MPYFGIINVTKEHPNGKVDGTLLEGCSLLLEEATERTTHYARFGTPYTLVEIDKCWHTVAQQFHEKTPLCEIFRA